MHLFNGVPGTEQAAFAIRLTRQRFLPGEDVIVQGRVLNCIYVLESGSADVWRLDFNGRKQPLNRLGVGATCGEVSLLTGNPASATVTAATEVWATVMTRADFLDIAARFPVVYRNVSAILAERLVQADQRSELTTHGALMWLVDHGAPPLLPYALACSIAWHTRTETAILVADGEHWSGALPSDALRSSLEGVQSGRRATASLHLRGPISMNGGPAADALRHRGANVLVHLNASEQQTVGPGTVVHVAPPDHVADAGIQSGHVVLRGWTEEPARRRGESTVPALTSADAADLSIGLLPTTTRVGRAVGVVARELCGLRVGIALGEGSAKGFAHLGVLRSLERAKIPCDAIAGTSIGAAVAGLYAAGFSVDDSQAHLVDVGSATFRPVLRRGSFMSHVGVERIMRNVWGDETRIEDLPIPFAAVAADIVTGGEVILGSGLLWAAALASISIPGIYPPQRMGELLLVDGGVVNPVPSDVAGNLGSDIVIAVRLSIGRRPVPVTQAKATKPSGRPPSVMHTILRSRDMMQSRYRSAIWPASVVIEPQFPANTSMGLRDFSGGQRFVEVGERAGESAVSQLADVLPWVDPPRRP